MDKVIFGETSLAQNVIRLYLVNYPQFIFLNNVILFSTNLYYFIKIITQLRGYKCATSHIYAKQQLMFSFVS